jgi:hypothetical protein
MPPKVVLVDGKPLNVNAFIDKLDESIGVTNLLAAINSGTLDDINEELEKHPGILNEYSDVHGEVVGDLAIARAWDKVKEYSNIAEHLGLLMEGMDSPWLPKKHIRYSKEKNEKLSPKKKAIVSPKKKAVVLPSKSPMKKVSSKSVINPKTGKNILVGGKTYNDLIAEGYVNRKGVLSKK